jgi:hypothetical protein
MDETQDWWLKVVSVTIKGPYCNIICLTMSTTPAVYVELSGTTKGPIGSSRQIVEVDFGTDTAVLQTDRRTEMICEGGASLVPKQTQAGHPLFYDKKPLYKIDGEIIVMEVTTYGPTKPYLSVLASATPSKHLGSGSASQETAQPRLSNVLPVSRPALSGVNGR